MRRPTRCLDLHAPVGQNARVTKDEALKQLADVEVVPCVSYHAMKNQR
jgi:hypothetical protein